MGDSSPHHPVLLLLAVFSRHNTALEWTRDRAEQAWGDVALTSDVFEFTQTDYYHRTMGTGLKKMLFAFDQFIDPAILAEIKLQTNVWEAEYQQTQDWPEERPLNLDPGYLTSAKLVLATTKDRDHRIYLGQGIFAEVTLHYKRGRGWCGREWTYPDFGGPTYHPFLDRCRQFSVDEKHEF